MDDYISRQAAIDAVEKLNIIPSIDGTGKPTPTEDFRVQFLGTVLKATAADVVPVVHAYWIRQKENHEFKEALMNCSACGYPVSRWTGNTNFCPNCGAKMDEEE